MNLLRYSNFKGGIMINENLDQAKKLLRDTYKNNKVILAVDNKYEVDDSGLFLFTKDGEVVNYSELPDTTKELARQKFREIKVTPEENSKVEKGQIIKRVRELIGDKLGYAYLFTYLLLVERAPFDELKTLFDKLIEYKDYLSSKSADDKPLLRRPISNYIDSTVPNNFENLSDDLDSISSYKATRKIYNELTPELKKDYDAQPPVIKKQVEDLALAFGKLGLEGGSINKDVQDRLWKLFFGEIKIVDGKQIYAGQMRRFKTIRDFIKSAQNYLKNIDNTETVKFYEAIEKCNSKYGNYGGVQVCFDEANILILEIKSFQANQMMNSHTRHCIKDSIYHWDSYVGSDNNYNKQYYIYNFNLPSYDTKSVIGITIGPKQVITACHLKDDGGFKDSFKSLLKDWEKKYSVHDLWENFAPMTPAEMEAKKKRIIANREVVKKGLSLEQVKGYLVDDGADVNAGKGQALDNAVSEGNVEKVKFLLEFGASPNMRAKQEATVNKIAELSNEADEEASRKAFDILKLLLNAGAELTSTVFKGLLGDYEAVKFCLDNGLNPNFEDNLASRLAIKRGFFNILKLLIDRGASVTNRGLGIAWAYESGNKDIVNYLVDGKHTEGFERSMSWIGNTPKLSAAQRIATLKEMQKLIDDGKVPEKHLTETKDAEGKIKNSPYRINDGKESIRNATYQQVIAKYGNLYNWVVKTNYDTLKSAL